jgi:DNA (cytosine-5)-methyltransferase 1
MTPRLGQFATCIDLFAGAGGLAEGFRQAGWDVLAGADADAHASATFKLNFPDARVYKQAISSAFAKVLLRDLGIKKGELGCLIGGPPCQSFSYNNHHRSASDERARLFDHYLQIVAALRPIALVMENVPGMLTIGDGSILREIEDRLGRLGYSCEVRVLFSEDFGVPQARRRVFVIACSVGEADDLFPRGSHGPCEKPSPKSNAYVHHWKPRADCDYPEFVTVWDAISDLPLLQNGGGKRESKYREEPRTDYQESARRDSTRLLNHVSHELTGTVIRRIERVPEGGNWRDIPRRMLPSGMKRAEKSDHTKRYGRLRRKEMASTILTKCDPHWGAYVHPTQDRTISVREAARLQGFPDRFEFAGSYLSRQYEQVGNAVPPPMAAAVARKLKRVLRNRVAADD